MNTLANSLQARLNLLNEAVEATEVPNCKNCPYKVAVKDEYKEEDEDREDTVNKFARHSERLFTLY